MIKLIKLTKHDSIDVFEMLKGIGNVENSYTNPTYDMSFAEFKEWLLLQEHWSKGEMLPKGYVPQTIYWLYDDSIPVGMGKIRHELTDESRINGGNIGYAISLPFRGKGYGEKLLKLLLEEAKKIGVKEIVLTIDKDNEASRRICEKNRGILFDENSERFFYRIPN